jgi:hypothetical protein
VTCHICSVLPYDKYELENWIQSMTGPSVPVSITYQRGVYSASVMQVGNDDDKVDLDDVMHFSMNPSFRVIDDRKKDVHLSLPSSSSHKHKRGLSTVLDVEESHQDNNQAVTRALSKDDEKEEDQSEHDEEKNGPYSVENSVINVYDPASATEVMSAHSDSGTPSPIIRCLVAFIK